MLGLVYLLLSCTDTQEYCQLWKEQNQCNENPSYMLQYCQKSCNACDTRCDNTRIKFKKGFINNTIQNLKSKEYNFTILSQNPWIVQFHNFLSDYESDHIITLCDGRFERSQAGYGVVESRTSEQCWCQEYSCTKDNIIKTVEKRVANIVNMPVANAEYMQILKYNSTQYYKNHHDQNAGHDSIQGPRVYTFFLYLNTVEEGGETYFTDLNITVRPVKNSAILWNSIIDAEEGIDEIKTHHEAKPVIKGIKYAANLWFHMGKFRTLSEIGCRLTHIPNYDPKNTMHKYLKYKDEV